MSIRHANELLSRIKKAEIAMIQTITIRTRIPVRNNL